MKNIKIGDLVESKVTNIYGLVGGFYEDKIIVMCANGEQIYLNKHEVKRS